MKPSLVFVSFCTKGIYEKVIKTYLIPSLKKFGLNYDIEYIKNKGSWRENIQYKPILIYNMLLKYKCPIVSLDADAIIEKNPLLFKSLTDCDYACHFYDWGLWYNKPGKEEMLGGTQYFNYNNKVITLVKEWMKQQKIQHTWAQKVLEGLLNQNKNIKIYRLPIEYCFIKTGKHPEIRKNAVIYHNQVSRQYRNKRW